VHFNTYGGNGNAAELAATLVNLRPDASPSAVAAALAAYVNPHRPAPDEHQARELLAWARQLDSVFGAWAINAQVDIANQLLAASASAPRITRHDDKALHLHYVPDNADTVTAVKAFTVAGVAIVICHEPRRLGRCARDGCPVVYVDTSPNGRRRYCSTRCANHVGVTNHRSRRKGAQPPEARPARDDPDHKIRGDKQDELGRLSSLG